MKKKNLDPVLVILSYVFVHLKMRDSQWRFFVVFVGFILSLLWFSLVIFSFMNGYHFGFYISLLIGVISAIYFPREMDNYINLIRSNR